MRQLLVRLWRHRRRWYVHEYGPNGSVTVRRAPPPVAPEAFFRTTRRRRIGET